MKIQHSRITLNNNFIDKDEAIAFVGKHLVNENLVSQDYATSMFDREKMTTTYIGNGVAIPHGTDEARVYIKNDGLVIAQVPEGVAFGNDVAYMIFGLAGTGEKHMEFLSQIAIICSDVQNVEKMKKATTKEAILSVLEGSSI